MIRKAAIISLKGLTLNNNEKKLILKEKPWGVILFKRNIKTFNQTKKLIKDIRRTIKDKKYPIIIDEEGGECVDLAVLLIILFIVKSFSVICIKKIKNYLYLF